MTIRNIFPILTATLLLLAAPTGLAGHTDAERDVTFDHKTGNEWWVEVVLGGSDAGAVTGVDVRDTDGDWVALEKRSWGAWAASFQIEPGHRVQFRAHLDGQAETSCWFTHPEGVERCKEVPEELEYATFVQVDADGTESVQALDTTPDGGVLVASSFRVDGRSSEVALTRYDAEGQFVWQRTFGSSSIDLVRGVAVDGTGHAYLVGQTHGEDLPEASGAASGITDAWVAKFSPTGELVWSAYLGGSDGDQAHDVAVRPGGVAVAGFTFSCDFPTTPDAAQPTSVECIEDDFNRDGFVTFYEEDGTRTYSTLLGGDDADEARGVSVGPDGTLAVVGYTRSSDFPTTLDAPQATPAGGNDGFVTRMSASGAITYSTYLGGGRAEILDDVDHDKAGAVYVTGWTRSADYPTTAGAHQTTYSAGNACWDYPSGPGREKMFHDCPDVPATKIDPDGSIAYSTYLGDVHYEAADQIRVDGLGRATVAGRQTDPDDIGEDDQTGSSAPSNDALAAALSPDGSQVAYHARFGGTDGDFGHGLALASDGSAWVGGRTTSHDFPTTPDAYEPTHTEEPPHDSTGFLARLRDEGAAGGGAVTFDSRNGNEWWVQVRVSDASPTRVQAQDDSDAWRELELKDWGDWAASFHVEPGHDVRYRAMVGGEWTTSCWFTHPEGKAPDGGDTCTGDGGGAAPPPSGFDASFDTPGGNEWWVEVYVDADETVVGVDARDGGGAWVALEKKDWGAWARSFHVEDGSVVEFRARSSGGDTDVSDGYVWPEGNRA